MSAITRDDGDPFFELDKNGMVTSTLFGNIRTIGTINVSSIDVGAFETLSNDRDFKDLVEDFRDLVCKVTSC
jgi:hypothetical protein